MRSPGPPNSFTMSRNAATRRLRRRGALAAATNEGVSAGAPAASVTPSHALSKAARPPSQRNAALSAPWWSWAAGFHCSFPSRSLKASIDAFVARRTLRKFLPARLSHLTLHVASDEVFVVGDASELHSIAKRQPSYGRLLEGIADEAVVG